MSTRELLAFGFLLLYFKCQISVLGLRVKNKKGNVKKCFKARHGMGTHEAWARTRHAPTLNKKYEFIIRLHSTTEKTICDS